MSCPVFVDVLDREEPWTPFSTAGADPTVRRKHLLLYPVGVLFAYSPVVAHSSPHACSLPSAAGPHYIRMVVGPVDRAEALLAARGLSADHVAICIEGRFRETTRAPRAQFLSEHVESDSSHLRFSL